MAVDMTAAANSAAAVKAAIASLKTDYDAARLQVTTLTNQIATLRKASIPAADVVPFLKDYIDAKANEFVGMLNEELAQLVFPPRGGVSMPNQREPISFDELEQLLTKDGESLMGSDYWVNAGRSNGATPGYKMLALLSSKNDYGFGRAFCFYFGADMKAALDANAAKIVVPQVPASKMDNSTRAQRRVTLATLQTQLTTAQDSVKTIQGQLLSLGARFDPSGSVIS